AKDNDGWTSQHLAALHGQATIVQLLLARGASISARDTIGRTPLIVSQADAITLLLLDRGSDIAARDVLGRTSLHFAASFQLHAVATLLLDWGVNVGTQDTEGHTPLSYAAEHGDAVLLELLFNRGA
ncbi:ankyrin repeat-containing domain protein, partial [Trichophaea hybrida]